MKFNIVAIILFAFLEVSAQDTICDLSIKNKNISFEVYTYHMDFTEDERPKSNKLIETNIKNHAVWDCIKTLTTDQWIYLLNKPESDWAANLILYQLYEREAILFSYIIRRREDWIGYRRDGDIAYWKAFLIKNAHKP